MSMIVKKKTNLWGQCGRKAQLTSIFMFSLALRAANTQQAEDLISPVVTRLPDNQAASVLTGIEGSLPSDKPSLDFSRDNGSFIMWPPVGSKRAITEALTYLPVMCRQDCKRRSLLGAS